jgi:hypothetical protein
MGFPFINTSESTKLSDSNSIISDNSDISDDNSDISDDEQTGNIFG